MALELPGWVVSAFYLIGLPWPAIDEDQLRAWGTGVRTFADDLADSSARTQQSVAELAGSCESSAADVLAAHWDDHNQLIAGLHGPMYDFADALDVAADAVVAQKVIVIGAAVALAGEFVATQAGALVTAGTDELLLAAEIEIARKTVKFALEELEAVLIQQLANVAARIICDHVNSFLGALVRDAPAVAGEIGALKISYGALRDAAQRVRGHAFSTEEAGDTAYAQNANRDLADGGERGVGSQWAAVVEGVRTALLDVAVDLFQQLPRLVVDRQRSLAEGLDEAATSVEHADREAGADVPADRDGAAAVLGGTALAGTGTALLGRGTEVPGTAGGDLAGAGGLPGAADPVQARISAADPVDVVTGDVLLGQADVNLPGMLPLVLERTHRSAMRTGRWFGPSWASTFDQRLLVGAGEVIGAFADGRVLTWPRPADADAEPVLPLSGAAWPLRREAGRGYSVTDPQRGLTWRFEPLAGYRHDQDGAGELPLVALTDRAGNEIAFHYDAAGQPAGVSHCGGYRVRVTTAGGRVTGLALTGRDGQADLPLAGYGYDAAGNLAEVTNSSGRPLAFSYDGARRLTGWTDRNGQSYRYDYDERGRCVRGAGAGGALSGTFGYEAGLTRWTDAAGAVTSYTLTSDAQVSAVTDPLGNVTRWEHDARGRVTTRIDPLGNVTRYAYDAAGNLTAVTRPDGSQAVAEYADGLLVALTGPDGATWRQEHDECGNRTALVAPDGTVTRFDYDADGHLARVTDPAGAVTQVAADAAGLPVAVVSPAGARTRYERDAFGRVTAVTGPDGAVTRLEWTPEGHLAARTLPDGTQERWTYDGEGNLVARLDAAGAATGYEYGPFDRLTAVTGPDGTRTQFGYDHELRLTSVLHGGLTWRYEYDQAGRLTAETDYNAATTRYSYDAAGRLAGRVNAAGQRVDFRYDVLGNLAEREADGMATTFGYDAAGRLVAARGPDADLRFEFDALGRVTAETCNGRTVRTEYDQAGRVARRVTPSGAATGWEYGLDGRPAVMLAGPHEIRFGYDPAGRETRRDLPGGLTLSQEWDGRGRLTLQALTAAGGPPAEGPVAGGRSLQRRAYRYRPDGLVAGIDDLLTGGRTVGLDPAGRVTAVTGQDWAERYVYDQAGNLATASWPAPPPGPVPASGTAAWLGDDSQGRREVSGSLVTRAGNIRYRHDRQGRVTRRQRIRISRKPDTWHYEWDADNRLRSVTAPDGAVWRYRYDPLGRRIAKEHVAQDGTVTARTDFSWDGPVLAEQSATGATAATRAAPGAGDTVTWNYLPGTFTPVTQAERACQEEIDQRFYAIVTDLVGTPAELAAADGTLAGRRRQTLWGGTTWEPGGASTPLRFPGQYEDEETGLHYNNQRYYDPVSGAYLTPDPLGLAPAPNPHAYVPNPQVLTDPLGLMACGGNGQPGAPMWTETKTMTPAENALRHFRDHGSDFPDAQNAVQYVTKAQGFLNNPPGGSLIRFRANGDKVVYQPGTEFYGVMRADGAPRTFFIPDPAHNGGLANLDYFRGH